MGTQGTETSSGMFDNLFRRALTKPKDPDLTPEEQAWMDRVNTLPEGKQAAIQLICCSKCPHCECPEISIEELFERHGLLGVLPRFLGRKLSPEESDRTIKSGKIEG